MCFNNNEKGDEVKTERQVFGSSEEDEFRVEDTARNADNLIQISQQQQQPLAPVVKWERYLPVRSLKVLLVENDDSTRHIVTALLKNCSYEVTAVSDVLEAWRILEDEKSCIDLVLTEVVMPVHSGTGLLSKIMSHNTLKNIPVIMMSSQWFWSLSVCRMVLCHSSSGSGSESGIQDKKSVKPESTEGSENDASISDEHRNENGSSGTQSSWTKRASDTKSTSPSNQLPDAPSKKETYENGSVHVNKPKEVEDQKEQIGTGSQTGLSMSKKAEEPGDLEKDAKSSVQALERNNDDMLNRSSGNSQVESKTSSSNREVLQSLEQTLKKPRETGDYRTGDQSVLRHSNHSAFSKYNNGATSAIKAPEENVGSCSPHDSLVAKLLGSGSSSDNPLNQQSSGSDRSAQREAALMKFRLKRKERCFEKKVRYHSRKKLAEQRPRVKGQFICKRDDYKSGSDDS
ncbi:CheY-like superfamily [Arabidopsis suecica]|uniref:CheY-like superfamily n=1 Tax=Arabidopsis suecica TaxID=45249 RepID=A0A8T1XV99_ARASU|nr:CheY-like superfamily [Arabidopsis suecica]